MFLLLAGLKLFNESQPTKGVKRMLYTVHTTTAITCEPRDVVVFLTNSYWRESGAVIFGWYSLCSEENS